jgi:hypothetical protein
MNAVMIRDVPQQKEQSWKQQVFKKIQTTLQNNHAFLHLHAVFRLGPAIYTV